MFECQTTLISLNTRQTLFNILFFFGNRSQEGGEDFLFWEIIFEKVTTALNRSLLLSAAALARTLLPFLASFPCILWRFRMWKRTTNKLNEDIPFFFFFSSRLPKRDKRRLTDYHILYVGVVFFVFVRRCRPSSSSLELPYLVSSASGLGLRPDLGLVPVPVPPPVAAAALLLALIGPPSGTEAKQLLSDTVKYVQWRESRVSVEWNSHI